MSLFLGIDHLHPSQCCLPSHHIVVFLIAPNIEFVLSSLSALVFVHGLEGFGIRETEVSVEVASRVMNHVAEDMADPGAEEAVVRRVVSGRIMGKTVVFEGERAVKVNRLELETFAEVGDKGRGIGALVVEE